MCIEFPGFFDIGVSAAANMAVDHMITGSDSEISARIQEYMDKGYGAKHSAALAIAGSIVPEMLAGGLSGLGMSAIYQGFGSGTNYVADKVSGGGKQTADAGSQNGGVNPNSGKVTFEDVVFMMGDEKDSSGVLQDDGKNGIINTTERNGRDYRGEGQQENYRYNGQRQSAQSDSRAVRTVSAEQEQADYGRNIGSERADGTRNYEAALRRRTEVDVDSHRVSYVEFHRNEWKPSEIEDASFAEQNGVRTHVIADAKADGVRISGFNQNDTDIYYNGDKKIFGHEYTHLARRRNESGYRAVVGKIRSAFTPEHMEQIVRRYVADYEAVYGEDYDAATEEFVSDVCGRVYAGHTSFYGVDIGGLKSDVQAFFGSKSVSPVSDGSIRYFAKVRRFRTGTEANTLALQWAHGIDVDVGMRVVVFDEDVPYLIEKIDDFEKYGIVRRVRKRDAERWEVYRGERSDKYDSEGKFRGERTVRFDEGNRSKYTSEDDKRDVYYYDDRHGGEITGVSMLDSESNGRGQVGSKRERDHEGSVGYRQKVRDGNLKTSLALDTDVKSSAAETQQNSGKVTFEDVVFMMGDEKDSSGVLQDDGKNGNGEQKAGGIDKYTYAALARKADMPVTELNKSIPRKSNGDVDKAKVAELGVADVRKQANPKNTDERAFMYVPDIGLDVLVGKDRLRHGLNRNSEATAQAIMDIGSILKNAIVVNELKPKGTTEGGYVLVGVGRNQEGAFFPTRIIVNRYGNSAQIGSIEPLNTVYAVKAKKRGTSLQNGAGFVGEPTPLNASSSTITIADFLDIVKGGYADTLSEDVLSHYGMGRPKSALSDSVVYSVGSVLPKSYQSPQDAVVLSEAEGLFGKLGFTVTTVPRVSNMPIKGSPKRPGGVLGGRKSDGAVEGFTNRESGLSEVYSDVDGYVDFKNREVYINPKAKNPQEVVIKHELTHILERSSGSRYVIAVMDAIKEKMPEQWEKQYRKNWEKYEKLSETNPDLAPTKSRITSETLADFSMYFAKDDVIQHYAKNANNRSFVQAIRDFFRYIRLQAVAIFGKGDSAFYAECAIKWERALKEAVEDGGRNVHVSGKDAGYDVMFSKEKSFSEQVHETLSGKVDDGNMVYVGETPMLLKKLGLHNKPMLITRGHLRDMHHEKSETESKYHGLSEDIIDKLPDILHHPAIVFDSISTQNPDGVCILSEMTDGDGNPLLISIRPDGTGRYNNVTIDMNIVSSMYGKENFQGYLNALGEHSENVLYMDKKRTQQLLNARGLQLPTGLSNLRFDSIIHQSRNVVKRNRQETLENIPFMISNSGDASSSTRTVDDIVSELEEVDRLLDDDSLSEEAYRRLDRRSRKLERELTIASTKGNRELSDSGFVAQSDTESRVRSSYHTERLRDAVDAYQQTGDASGIPSKKSADAARKRHAHRLDEIEAEIADIASEWMRGGLTGTEMQAMADRYKTLQNERAKELDANRVLSKVQDVLTEIDTAARPNHTWVEGIAPDLADKKNFIKNGTYGFNDFERNLRHFFGKHFPKVKEKILTPLYESKKRYAEYVEDYSDRIYNEVVKDLGIKKGSKWSEAVQWLGEGEKPAGKKLGEKISEKWYEENGEYEPYDYERCRKEFGAETADKIQKAADIFRECYDQMLDDINATRAKIYPNNPEKLIPKRKDYFRHFQEMNNSLPGLIQTAKHHAGISPELVGVSEVTKPKSKWTSVAQARTGKRTKIDAVGGFLDYLPQAAYATHIDPNIVNIRSLAYDLAMAKSKEGENGNPNANSFIRYLQNYANKLAGKTVSHLDRAIHDSTLGRPLTSAINWFNNRAKANAVLGNFSSMLSQFANIANIVGEIGHSSDVLRGAMDAGLGLFGNKDVRAAYENSGFLKERFLGKKMDRFDRYGLTRLAADALGIADEVGTRISWCAALREAERLGVSDKYAYADSLARRCVAGRGIGEIPLNFESTVSKLFLPFRLEVNNNINVYRDILFGEDYDTDVDTGAEAEAVLENYSDREKENWKNSKSIVSFESADQASNFVDDAIKGKNLDKKMYFGEIGDALADNIKQKTGIDLLHYNCSLRASEVRKILLYSHGDPKREADRGQRAITKDDILSIPQIICDFDDVILDEKMYNGKPVIKFIKELNGKTVVVSHVSKNHLDLTVQTMYGNKKRNLATTADVKSPALTSETHSSTVPNNIISQDGEKVKESVQTDFDKITEAGQKKTSSGVKRLAVRTEKILRLFVFSAILNAIMGALKSDEFNPLEDLFGEDEEEKDILERIRDLRTDYLDGTGDGVLFDLIGSAVMIAIV